MTDLKIVENSGIGREDFRGDEDSVMNKTDSNSEIEKIFEADTKEDIEDKTLKKTIDSFESKNFTIWLTGLPCSGKTTLGKRLKKELIELGYNVAHLDGDILREGLNEDLSFSEEDRIENLRRAAHISRLFNENGQIIIASFITPTNEMRKKVKEIVGNIRMVYLKCSLEECEKRDVKGMYAKARKGMIKGFTGIDSPFEEPNEAIVINVEKQSIEESIKEILKNLLLI